MTPSRPHAPPRPNGALQSDCGGPPSTSTFDSLPFAKNPMCRLSGDQKGITAFSVPTNDFVESESSDSTHRSGGPSFGRLETKASSRPFGDKAAPVKTKVALRGGRIYDRTISASAEGRIHFSTATVVNTEAAATTVHSVARSQFRRGTVDVGGTGTCASMIRSAG